MSDLATTSEVVVAEDGGAVIGGVAYVPPNVKKALHFDANWPIIRMLVVDPLARGMGTGRALTEECVFRARRDKATIVALHTSPIMRIALPMYLRMGFERLRDAPPICGVPYAVYVLKLG
jgi:GNAT superfamily N-acetyltransferase